MGSASNEPDGYRLGRRQLWLLPCGTGAYNDTSALDLTETDGTNARPLPLPGPRVPASETDGRTQLVNAGARWGSAKAYRPTTGRHPTAHGYAGSRAHHRHRWNASPRWRADDRLLRVMAGEVYRIGDVRCTRVADLENFRMPAARMFASVTPADLLEVERAFGPGFVDCASSEIIISFNAYIVDDGSTVILVDPCIGDGKSRPQYALWHQRRSPFLRQLADVGYPPESIDVVISTHLHADHVGWNTSRRDGSWVPTFPNAQYLFVRDELSYWRDRYASTGDPDIAYGSYVDSVLPILEAGVGKTIDAGGELARGVRIRQAPGHTPGNVVIEIAGGGSGAVITGDVVHHPLQILQPSLSTNFCLDPVASSATRRSLIADYAKSGALLFPAHFVAPAAGRIVPSDGTLRYEFERGS